MSTKIILKKKKVVVENVIEVELKTEIANLIELRKKHKIRQSEMCKILGTSRANYSNIETGRTELSLKSVKKICEFFEITASEFLEF